MASLAVPWMLLISLVVYFEGNRAQNLTSLTTSVCGDTHGCWSFPPKCESDKCSGIVRWKLLGPKRYSIEMQAKDVSSFENGRYMAVGFSEDIYMGSDTVLECVIDANGETGEAYVSYNDGPTNYQLLDASQKLLKNKQTLLKDGKMMCKFELDLTGTDKVSNDEKPLIYDLENSYWTLLFASGLASSDTGEKQIHSLQNDEFYPWATKETVNLKDTSVVTEMSQY